MKTKDSNEIKNDRIGFRCTPKFKKDLQRRARKEGMVMGEYLIKLAENGTPDEQLRKRAADILEGVNHVNELLRLVYETGDKELIEKSRKIMGIGEKGSGKHA